jgi:hypothetical protein
MYLNFINSILDKILKQTSGSKYFVIFWSDVYFTVGTATQVVVSSAVVMVVDNFVVLNLVSQSSGEQ